MLRRSICFLFICCWLTTVVRPSQLQHLLHRVKRQNTLCGNTNQPATGTCQHESHCGSTTKSCVNGLCCDKTQAWQFVCGGDAAVSAAFPSGTCGGGYFPFNGYCCSCPNGQRNGGYCLTQTSCPQGYTCQQQTRSCCATGNINPGPQETVQSIGACINGLCPPNYNCLCNGQPCATGQVGGQCGARCIGSCTNGLCPSNYRCIALPNLGNQQQCCR